VTSAPELGVLGVAPVRSLEADERSGTAGQHFQFGLQRIARADMEAGQPLAQAGPEPAGPAFLAAEVDLIEAAVDGNPQFAHFLEYLGRFIIPRQSIRVAAHRPEGQRAYLETFQREHVLIFAAISAGDAAAAREAMRQHLGNSQARYRRLAAEAGSTATTGSARIARES